MYYMYMYMYTYVYVYVYMYMYKCLIVLSRFVSSCLVSLCLVLSRLVSSRLVSSRLVLQASDWRNRDTCCSGPIVKLEMGKIQWLLSVNFSGARDNSTWAVSW